MFLTIFFSFFFPFIPTGLVQLITDHVGLDIAVILCIASPFSRHIAICNGGPTSALQSMGAKRHFRCNFFNIALIYKQ